MPNGITPTTFKGYSAKSQRETLFDIQIETQQTLLTYISKTDKRFESGNKKFHKLEKGRLKDKGFAGLTGIIGGFLASLVKGG